MSLLAILEINNRDISVLVWLGIIFMWALRNRSVRKAFANVLKVMADRVIIVSLALMILYIVAISYCLAVIGIWEIGNLKDTIIWVFGSAFVLYVNINRVNQEGYIINSVIDSLKVVVLVEFIINLYVFNIWIELILVPILFFLWGMLGYASVYQKYERVENLLNKVLGIIGIGILIFTIVSITQDIKGFFSFENLRDLLVPILLAIGFIPFLYFFGLFILYDSIFNRLKIYSINPKIASHAKLKSFLAFNLNLSAVRAWSSEMGMLKLKSKKDIEEAIFVFKSRSA